MQLLHEHLHTLEFAGNISEGLHFSTDTVRYIQLF